jgi:tetratricopeptide (TPR) repeat protein
LATCGAPLLRWAAARAASVARAGTGTLGERRSAIKPARSDIELDREHYAAAEAAYAAEDWREAALQYLTSVHGVPSDGTGAAYHKAGNALVRLGRYEDAIGVYRYALGDPSYDRHSTVHVNLGTALEAQERHSEAVSEFEEALADPAYPTPYKALQGKGRALFELGRFGEAAEAYRQAAWTEGNPDSGRALNNLGLSFLAQDKPQEAVEAFRAAVGVRGYTARGRATANLGLAYAKMGFHEEAVREFDKAQEVYGYALAGETLSTYEASRSSLIARGPAESTARDGSADDSKAPTGQAGAGPDPAADALTGEAPTGAQESGQSPSRFFTISEKEMRDENLTAERAQRKEGRRPRWILTRILLVLVIVIALAGSFGGVLYYGYGYPTQEQTVTSLLAAYSAGGSYSGYWVAVPQIDLQKQMMQLPARYTSFRIAGVDRSALKSTARVVVRLQTGAQLDYEVLLVREGVGWKVDGILSSWSSTSP